MKTETALDPRVEETRAVNEQIEKLMASLPPTYTIPPAETRKARAEGKGLLPLPPRLDDIAKESMIPGRAGDIALRVFVPETVTGAVLHIHGGGWTFGANHRYTPSSTFSMSTSTSTSPRATLTCATPRRR
jgi:acetyl esterase/lipase